MTNTLKSFDEVADRPAQLVSLDANPGLNSPALTPDPIPASAARDASAPRQEATGPAQGRPPPAPIPPVCPVCGAPVEPARVLDSVATRGWWCQLTRSLHFWQWRAAALQGSRTTRQYVLPPAPGRGGLPRYPGVTFEDLGRAQRQMERDRACWAAEGYDPTA